MPRKTKMRKSKLSKLSKRKSKSLHKTRGRGRRYRGGCNDSACLSTSLSKPWISGGAHPEQISKDIYNYKTDPYFYSS